MNERTQIRGHCQICGRQQAIVSGRIAAHGYTLRHGWFEGVCPGHNYRPLEIARGTLDAQAEAIRREIPQLEAHIARVTAGEEPPRQARASHGPRAPMVDYADAPAQQQREARNAMVAQLRRRIEGGRAWLTTMPAFADKVHGQPLTKVKVGGKPQIEVGSKVKLLGREVIVSRIAYAETRGVGPGMNGKVVEHVYWAGADGKERCYPKRYARIAG